MLKSLELISTSTVIVKVLSIYQFVKYALSHILALQSQNPHLDLISIGLMLNFIGREEGALSKSSLQNIFAVTFIMTDLVT